MQRIAMIGLLSNAILCRTAGSRRIETYRAFTARARARASDLRRKTRAINFAEIGSRRRGRERDASAGNNGPTCRGNLSELCFISFSVALSLFLSLSLPFFSKAIGMHGVKNKRDNEFEELRRRNLLCAE